MPSGSQDRFNEYNKRFSAAAIISNSSRIEQDSARRPCRSSCRRRQEDEEEKRRVPHHTRGAPRRRGITQRAPAVSSFLRSVYNVLSTRVASLLAFRCIINDRLALCTTAHTSAPSLRRSVKAGQRDFSFSLPPRFAISPVSPSRSTSVSWMHSDFLCGLSSSTRCI